MGYYTNNGGLIGTNRIQGKEGVYDLPHSLAADFLFRFSSFTFTNPIEGPWGPTSSQILNEVAYSSSVFANNNDFFRVIEGIQYWKVPVSRQYTITAKGPAGRHCNGLSHEGRGGIVRASFLLLKGTILAILVGSRPPISPIAGSAYPPWQGGAGGTFVAVVPDWGDNNDSSTYPLLVAGGGSANRNSSSTYRLQASANMNPNGKNGNGSDGGTAGEGAEAGGMYYTGGGGGAGWDGVQNASSDCRNLYVPNSNYPSSTSTCSLSRPGARGFNAVASTLFAADFVGTGGVYNVGYDTDYRGSGGYGGGGAGGWAGIGGGGGYSGGGNGDSGSYSRGGGGGSYIGSSAISTTEAGKNIGTSTGAWVVGGAGAFSGHSILAATSGLVDLGYNEGNGSVEITKW